MGKADRVKHTFEAIEKLDANIEASGLLVDSGKDMILNNLFLDTIAVDDKAKVEIVNVPDNDKLVDVSISSKSTDQYCHVGHFDKDEIQDLLKNISSDNIVDMSEVHESPLEVALDESINDDKVDDKSDDSDDKSENQTDSTDDKSYDRDYGPFEF